MRRLARTLVIASLVLVTGIVLTGIWIRSKITSSDCFVADTTVVSSKRTHLEKNYSLMLVITGFQDKTRAIYLYEDPVSTDACGARNREPLASYFVDDSEGYKPLAKVRVLSRREIDVVFTDADVNPASEVPVEWSFGE